MKITYVCYQCENSMGATQKYNRAEFADVDKAIEHVKKQPQGIESWWEVKVEWSEDQ